MGGTKFFAKNISHLTDARYFAAMGVEWMGFEINSETGLSRVAFDAIIEWIEGPKIAVSTEGVIEGYSNILSLIDGDHIDHIIELPIEQFIELENTLLAEVVILKADNNIRPTEIEKHLKKTSKELYLESNFSNAELISITKNAPQLGIVIQGSQEEKIGFKSYEELDELFEALVYES